MDSGDIFGDDSGVEQSLDIIQTVGGAHRVRRMLKPMCHLAQAILTNPTRLRNVSAAGPAKLLDDTKSYALSQPQAAGAAADWDDMRGSYAPYAKDLSRQDAYDWLMSYMEWKHGDITEETLAAEQLDIERRYDASPAKAVAGNRGDGAGGAGQPALAEGDRTPETTAEPEAQKDAADADQGTQDLGERRVGLVAQLRRLSKEPKQSVIAKDFLKRAAAVENVDPKQAFELML